MTSREVGAEFARKKRRLGRPRTEEERKKRHKALYGTDKLPPRGTGLMK